MQPQRKVAALLFGLFLSDVSGRDPGGQESSHYSFQVFWVFFALPGIDSRGKILNLYIQDYFKAFS